MIGRTNYILLREVAERLLAQPDLLCNLRVDMERGVLVVFLQVPSDGAGLDVVELAQQLDYLASVGNVRAFAEQYGIAPESIEALLRNKEENQ